MQLKRLAATTTLAAVVSLGMASAAYADPSSTPTPATENACTNGHWPADTQNRPASLQPGAVAGLYLWHTDNGWHAFVTHPGNDKVVFTGRIVSSGKIEGVARDTERRDHVRVSKRDKTIAYRFTNFGHLDGLHFRTRCAQSITVTGSLNGHLLSPDQVFIGSAGNHPATVAFTITRTV